MKKSAILGVVFAFGSSSFEGVAAMNSELKVKGEITTPTCNITPPDEGVYDLGKISSAMIQTKKSTALGEISKRWGVNCGTETYLGFSVVDNREGTASKNSAGKSKTFGLGYVNNTGKLGNYTVELRNAVVDGSSSSIYSTKPGSSRFSAKSKVFVEKNKLMGWASSRNTQRSGRDFSMDMVVSPWLSSSSDMNGLVSDLTKLDGSMTVNFVFGL